MGRQKAVIKARREAKRVFVVIHAVIVSVRRNRSLLWSRWGGLKPSVWREKIAIPARTIAQEHYLSAIENKQLIFATGEAGCGKTFLSAAKAAEALIHKEVERIIVTRPVTPYNTWAILLLAYSCLLLPYPIRYVSAALRQLGPNLEAAARVHGASTLRALRRLSSPA